MGNADALTVVLDGRDAPERLTVGGVALPPRQREVLALLTAGYTNKEVAAQLSISVKTVETHRARLYERLGCASRADLVRAARGAV